MKSSERKIDDGGFALPTSNETWGGLTKREHFAGLALQGLLANPNIILYPENTRVALHNECVWHADALLAALAQDAEGLS